MSTLATTLLVLAGALVAVVTVVLGRRDAAAARQRAEAEIATMKADAAARIEETRTARAELAAERDRHLERLSEREAKLDQREQAVTERALKLDTDARAVDKQQADLRLAQERVREEQARLRTAEAELDTARARAETEAEQRRRQTEDQQRQAEEERRAREQEQAARLADELARVSGLSREDARAEMIAAQTETARRQALVTVREIEEEARRSGEFTARRIVSDAVQRVAAEQTAESVVSVVHLPSEDLKGRIIGREGRNIRSFEAVTGVNLVIDDSPGAVLLSCFDPVRRERARVALEALVKDGRIHPHRIEQAYEQATGEVEHLIAMAGAKALEDTGIVDLHPDLVHLLGTLRYRTSYGQNVLGHLVETAHIAGMMAAEIGLHAPTVKRCAFLHDIGKALTHEVEGTHALIGADLARRYGEHEDVVHAIEAHHNEVQPQTVEAILTQASDACSGGRPGARREALESYVERLERMEAIASARQGVEKVFAMSAGRELRVLVQPEAVGDEEADLLARDIATQIADELTYPGQIKVTVVRESRASALAS